MTSRGLECHIHMRSFSIRNDLGDELQMSDPMFAVKFSGAIVEDEEWPPTVFAKQKIPKGF